MILIEDKPWSILSRKNRRIPETPSMAGGDYIVFKCKEAFPPKDQEGGAREEEAMFLANETIEQVLFTRVKYFIV